MFRIKIAGLVFEVDNRYSYVERICSSYKIVTDEPPVLRVSASTKDIVERIKKTSGFLNSERAEAYVLYDLMCRELHKYDAIMLHSSLVGLDGYAYAFSGKKGVGKSTQASLWVSYFKDKAQIVCGDKPILRFEDGKLYAYGTPFSGKEGYNINNRLQLKSICFLKQSYANKMISVSPEEFVNEFLSQTVLPSPLDADTIASVSSLLGRIHAAVPSFYLYCNMSDDAVITAYETINQ